MNATHSCTALLREAERDQEKSAAAGSSVRARLEAQRERLVIFLRRWNEAAQGEVEDAPDTAQDTVTGQHKAQHPAAAAANKQVGVEMNGLDMNADIAEEAVNDAEGECVERVESARARYGRPFAHERGSSFRWSSGPTVLNRWLAERTVVKHQGKQG